MAKNMKGKPLPQGCSVWNEGVNFSIAAGETDSCELLLFKKGETEPVYKYELKKEDGVGNLRCLSVPLEHPEEYEYYYLMNEKKILDQYAKTVETAGEELRANVKLDDFDWENDRIPGIPQNETIAYALHIKGYTMHWSSKVAHRGTFKGVLEKMDYIKSLGVNQLHLMPIYEFDDEVQGKTNYWGYGKGYYFAPKNAYAVNDAVQEVKEMVKAFHKESIEVILEMPFVEGTSQSLMLDALRYWRMEYHVDGFVLNPYTIDWRMVCTDPVLADAKLFKKQDDFQNSMRRFIKSDSGMTSPVMWWSKYIPEDGHTFNYITSQNGFTLQDLVSFNEKHNDENGEMNADGPVQNYSWNCGEEGESVEEDILAFRKKQKRNVLYTLFLSQGMPCLLAGDEFGNTQFGNNNPYCQDNEITWLNWKDISDNEDLLQFVKELIKFRKKYTAFHPEKQLEGSRSCGYGIPEISYHGEDAWVVNCDEENRSFGIFYHVKEQVEEFVLVLYNMHWENRELGLPVLPKGMTWYEAASTEYGVLKEENELEKINRIELEPRTVKVLVGK